MAGLDDQRTREGVEHLQAAARELISAARAFLDVAEEVVADPAAMQAWARSASELWRSLAASAGQGGSAPEADEPRVHHIPVQ